MMRTLGKTLSIFLIKGLLVSHIPFLDSRITIQPRVVTSKRTNAPRTQGVIIHKRAIKSFSTIAYLENQDRHPSLDPHASSEVQL
jgi:hypothetical protein